VPGLRLPVRPTVSEPLAVLRPRRGDERHELGRRLERPDMGRPLGGGPPPLGASPSPQRPAQCVYRVRLEELEVHGVAEDARERAQVGKARPLVAPLPFHLAVPPLEQGRAPHRVYPHRAEVGSQHAPGLEQALAVLQRRAREVPGCFLEVALGELAEPRRLPLPCRALRLALQVEVPRRGRRVPIRGARREAVAFAPDVPLEVDHTAPGVEVAILRSRRLLLHAPLRRSARARMRAAAVLRVNPSASAKRPSAAHSARVTHATIRCARRSSGGSSGRPRGRFAVMPSG
jgi:hypothetical protein